MSTTKANKFAKPQDTGAAKSKTSLKVVKEDAEDKPDTSWEAGKAERQARVAARTAAGGKPAPKEKAEKAPTVDKRKLLWASKENPKREGTAAYERFEQYGKAKTVQQYLEAGGTKADLAYEVKKGLVTISE